MPYGEEKLALKSARLWLGWSQMDLAARATLYLPTIQPMEAYSWQSKARLKWVDLDAMSRFSLAAMEQYRLVRGSFAVGNNSIMGVSREIIWS